VKSICRGVFTPDSSARQIDFTTELPRHATGKLYKRLLRDHYWGETGSRIV
jgi:long-chain acyl-CoA synthetase